MVTNKTTTNSYEDFPSVIREYLFYLLTVKGRSPKTVDGYAVDLKLFFRYLKKLRKKISDDTDLNLISIDDINLDLIRSVTLMDVYEFLNFTMSKRNNSSCSISRKVSSLRGFFKYLTYHTRVLSENPIEHLETPSSKKKLPIYLPLEDCILLLNTINMSNSPYKSRDFCIITFFLNCGMRLSELVGIDINDYDIKSGSLKLLGKGNKERIVYLNKACKEALTDYLKDRNSKTNIRQPEALFLSRHGYRLGNRQIECILSNYLKQCGLSQKGITPHKLRHTAATLLYRYGQVDLLTLKELLGHSNVGTTEIYTHIANEQVEKAVDKNPLVNMTPKIKQSKEAETLEENEENTY